ncbi:MAG: hypothetical protein KGJ07_00140 [Patescibacteria group bacterium]|nr:hypothetical protein [Patescibacteria group bacterium]
MCNYDYDAPRVYSDSVRKARKTHKCSECFRLINIGESYKYIFGIYGKDTSQFKTCSHCSEAQSWLFFTCGSFLHGDLQKEIHEHATESMNKTEKFMLYRLYLGIKKQWRRKNGSLMKIIDTSGYQKIRGQLTGPMILTINEKDIYK